MRRLAERVAPRPATLAPLLVVGLAVAIGLAPLGVAMGVVLLCAGPHNWCEARYFLSRMPRRWGPLRPFFLTALSGVIALTLAFVALAALPAVWPHVTDDVVDVALAGWLTLMVGWTAALVALRRRERAADAHVAGSLVPATLAVVAAVWLAPRWASVALVYLHPLLALVFLDRELTIRRAAWHPTYRAGLAMVPVALACLWLMLPATPVAAASPDAHQAGAFLLPPSLAMPLLATHVFLESLHYAVWIVGIPLATSAVPWHLRAVPLTGRSPAWRTWLAGGLAAGGLLVVALWILFAIDYETTRQVYFTVAIVHVLSEVPFLIRLH